MNNKKYWIYFLDTFLFLYSIFVGNMGNKGQIALLITFISIELIIKTRKIPEILLMFTIIGFINISISYTDIYNLGANVSDWQISLRMTEYTLITAKSLLIYSSTMNLFFNMSLLEKISKYNFEMYRQFGKKNIILSVVITIIMFCLYAIYYRPNFSTTGYISASNPIVEYLPLLFIMAAYYSKNNVYIKKLLEIFVLLFTISSLSIGDRSAMTLLIFSYILIYQREKIVLRNMLPLTILGITIINAIAILRYGNVTSVDEIIQFVRERMLYSDTVSFAFYSSISISAFKDVVFNQVYLFFEFIKGVIIGSSNVPNATLTLLASSVYFNRGGGLISAHLYFFGGNLLVVLGAIVNSIIILKASSKNNLGRIILIMVSAYSLRWYLYNPLILYRSCILIPTILYLFVKFVNRVLLKKVIT